MLFFIDNLFLNSNILTFLAIPLHRGLEIRGSETRRTACYRALPQNRREVHLGKVIFKFLMPHKIRLKFIPMLQHEILNFRYPMLGSRQTNLDELWQPPPNVS